MSALFIASVGNPAPYERTLHSAGHILLKALGKALNAREFTPNPSLRDGLTTEATLRDAANTRVTLWQSPSYMNDSGPAMVGAFKTWLKQQHLDKPALLPAPLSADDIEGGKLADVKNVAGLYRPRLRLVLLHDELEETPARLNMRYGGAERSSRGHRGVLSVVHSLVADGFLEPRAEKHQSGDAPRKKLKKTIREEKAKADAAAKLAKLAAKEAAKEAKLAAKEAAKAAKLTPKSSEEQQPEIEEIEEIEEIKEPEVPDTPEQAKLRRSFDSPVLTRFQIGIGRPSLRDADVVAKYVLEPMYGSHYVRTCAHGETVAHLLQEVILTNQGAKKE